MRAGVVVGEAEVLKHTTPRTSSNVAHNKSICRSGPAAAHANAMERAACCMLHVVRRTLRDTCCMLHVVCYAVCACTDYLLEPWSALEYCSAPRVRRVTAEGIGALDTLYFLKR